MVTVNPEMGRRDALVKQLVQKNVQKGRQDGKGSLHQDVADSYPDLSLSHADGMIQIAIGIELDAERGDGGLFELKVVVHKSRLD